MKKELLAYGKINLTLEILGVMENGYHQLRSVMQSISQFDRLIVENLDKGIVINCEDKTVPLDNRNTVYRAAQSFFSYTGINKGLSITIEKNLPHEAGLGAASSDAAAVLLYLWEEYNRPISFERLLRLGEGVGADVPFCLVGGTALAMGKGEILQSIKNMPDCEIVVIKPNVGASTPKMFAAYDNTVPVPENPDSLKLITAVESGDIKAVAKLVGDCLETSTGLREIGEAKSLLTSLGALGVSMTGSGSAVFGIFEAGFDTEEVCNKAIEKGYLAFSCRPIAIIK